MQSEAPNPDYVIKAATEAEAGDVHEFLYSPRHPALRVRPLEDIEEMTRKGLLFVVWAAAENRIVGACYLSDPGQAEPGEPPNWELGGARVDAAHRGRNLFFAIAIGALTQLVASDETAGREIPVMGHVLRGNPAPRRTMQKLGFEIEREDESFDPDGYPGLEHMEVGEDGLIHADILRLPEAALCGILDAAVTLLESPEIRFKLRAFERPEYLREVRAEICQGE